MADFARMIYDDFVNGDVVFVATRHQVDSIEEMIISYGDVRHNLVFRTHPIMADILVVGHRAHHNEWDGETITGQELKDNIAIQWDLLKDLIASLHYDSLDDIMGRFMRSEAYININPINEDVTDMIDHIGQELERNGVLGGHDYARDAEYTPTEYIHYLYEDYYRNLFVDTSMELELNASNCVGVGVASSSVYPSMVYPVAYLMKKASNNHVDPLYTEEDFNEIFN